MAQEVVVKHITTFLWQTLILLTKCVAICCLLGCQVVVNAVPCCACAPLQQRKLSLVTYSKKLKVCLPSTNASSAYIWPVKICTRVSNKSAAYNRKRQTILL